MFGSQLHRHRERTMLGTTHNTAPAARVRRALTTPRLLSVHTIQLCIHCGQLPAGFWVSRNSGQTVRRPWCLSCCQDLDRGCYHVRPFGS